MKGKVRKDCSVCWLTVTTEVKKTGWDFEREHRHPARAVLSTSGKPTLPYAAIAALSVTLFSSAGNTLSILCYRIKTE